MYSNFSFKNLLKRLPNVSMPKEFIYLGIGLGVLTIVGLVAGSMYLQEMLFFEGAEKSVQMFTEEELREYGDIYKELSLEFQNDIGAYTQDYANRTNRVGEKIHYGVYNHEHVDGNSAKIKPHRNGENTTNDGNDNKSDVDDSYNDYRVDYTYIDSDEFKNGVTIKYAKTEGREEGESNFQDILTCVSMILDQRQTRDDSGNTNIRDRVPNLIKTLFRMSHTFTGESSELYACEKGCRALFYYCNEVDNNYLNTGIDLHPFEVNPHDDFDDYSSDDFEIHDPEGECPLCDHNGRGCVVDSEQCFHSFDEDEDTGCEHVLGSSKGDCETAQAHYICEGHEVSDGEGGTTTEYCSDEIGEGHYDCPGHEHYDCEGHFYVCCMGHTDVTITVKIMYLDEMVNVLQNGYNTSSSEGSSD